MKVVQLVTQMEAGGAQRVAYLLKNELELRGYDSRLWFLYTKRPAYAREPGVESLLSHPPSIAGYLRIVLRLARMIYVERPDVLITHTHYANVLGNLVASILRLRTRIAVQHNPTHTFPRLARIADRAAGSVGLYSRIVAVSQTVAESVNRYPLTYRQRLTTAFNGVPEPGPTAPREITRKRWNIPAEAPLLVNVGRLSQQKNQEFLIRLLQKGADLHLLLVGEGELRDRLKAAARDLGVEARVHFTGEVTPDEVSALISAGDVFVLPSLFEAVSMVMLEAMLLGVPIVSSDIPSAREFLAEDGVLVETAYPEKWLAAIRMLLDRPELAAAMTTRAKTKAQRFTVPRMADAYERLIAPAGSLDLVESIDSIQ